MNWSDVLLAYLHDPPDKALSIRGHVPRARDNAQIALDDRVSRRILEDAVSRADPLASIIERFPMPTAGEGGKWAVESENGESIVVHPLSAASRRLSVPAIDDQLTRTEQDRLREIISDLSGEGDRQFRNRYLAIWRLWQGDLAAKVNPCLALLPADTRTPDHTIWNHLDVTAMYKAAESEPGGAALLAFALGPVQRFIEAARSVRDLWSGSMILSWLAFRAMLPVVEELGPTALVYPALRGNPLLDLWLRDEQRLGGKVPLPEVEQRLTPSLPHRFLAIVPWGADGAAAEAMAEKCRVAFEYAWRELADGVKSAIQAKLDSLDSGWDRRWSGQIAEYFSTSTAVVPLGGAGDEIDRQLAGLLANENSFAAAFRDAEAVREMARSIPDDDRPSYAQDHAGRWQYQVELVGRSLASQRSIRHVPAPPSEGNADSKFPQKCTLLGSFEQTGPDDLRQSRQFWDKVAPQGGLSVDGVRVRKGEALCAIAMVKRFADPAYLREELQLSQQDLRFPDTWTIAGGRWLVDADIDWKSDWQDDAGQRVPWNGHWLQWSRPDQNLDDAGACPADLWTQIQNARQSEQLGPPPVYFAILKLDGDDLGEWLRGANSPIVRETMHLNLVDYYENHCNDSKNAERLNAKRPVGPALHAAISTALSNFAMHVVAALVAKYHGTVIYSGGDDTLILLPVVTALQCASELQRAYTSNWYTANGREYLMMGSRATLSGGLVAVHAKDDLRLAVADARDAEKKAKDAGKDALGITIRRRSGQHTSAICPWEFAETVEDWRNAFSRDDGNPGASDRWAYHLAGEKATLAALPPSAMAAEIRRQVNRAEADTRRRLGEPNESIGFRTAGDLLAAQFSQYCDMVVNDRRTMESAGALDGFLTLCQSASFMARGRDE